MIENLGHRGPDNSGKWIAKDKNVYLQPIINYRFEAQLFQPMVSKSNRYIISYNGEIYNHLG